MKRMNILVVATRDPRQRYRFLTEPMSLIPQIQVEILKQETHLLKYIYQGIQYARTHQHIDLVIVVCPDYNVMVWLGLTKFIMGAKFVVRTGGDLLATPLSRLQTLPKNIRYIKVVYKFLESLLVSRTLRYADALIVVNNYLKHKMKRYVRSTTPITVIPQPVAIPGNRLSTTRTQKACSLLTVTNLAYKEKCEGVRKIIECLVMKSHQGELKHKVVFDIVGGGEYLPELQESVHNMRCNPGQLTINVVGYVPQPFPYYENADIFVYYSNLDGLPNVLLEAQSYGLPILVNEFKPFFDLLEPETHALFFDKNNMDDFFHQLNRLLQDGNLRDKIGQNNVNKVKADFSHEAVSRRIAGFLKSYVSQKVC